jgi:hypothetical protein
VRPSGSTDFSSSALHHSKSHQCRWQVRRSLRRHVREAHAARPAGLIAVRRQPHKQVIQQYLCTKLQREPCEPVGPRALAGIAAKPDEHVREVHKPPNAHTNKRFCSRMIFRSGLPSCRDPQIFRGRTRAGEERTQPGKCEPGEPQRCLQRHSSSLPARLKGRRCHHLWSSYTNNTPGNAQKPLNGRTTQFSA